MNPDDVIRMAREVFDIESDSRGRETFIADSYSIERFAELVAAAEREACAARLHEVAVHCERVEQRLREVNTAAMKLTSDLVCMEVDDDDRLSRDRVMERVVQWRNQWDKAMNLHEPQDESIRARGVAE